MSSSYSIVCMLHISASILLYCFVIDDCVILGPCYIYITFHLHQIDLSCTGFNVCPKCRLPIPQFYGFYCMYVFYTFVRPYITFSCFVIYHNCASSVDKGLYTVEHLITNTSKQFINEFYTILRKFQYLRKK